MAEHYRLPEGWTWRDVVASRVKYGTREDFYPLVLIPGVCAGWGIPFGENGKRMEVDE